MRWREAGRRGAEVHDNYSLYLQTQYMFQNSNNHIERPFSTQKSPGNLCLAPLLMIVEWLEKIPPYMPSQHPYSFIALSNLRVTLAVCQVGDLEDGDLDPPAHFG